MWPRLTHVTVRVQPDLRDRLLPWAALLARLLLAGVWLYAGASKVTDLPGSVRAVNAYQLIPVSAGQVVGAALPLAEITLGLLLLAGLGIRAGAVASAVLLTLFVAAIASAAARGLRIDCGCFGDGGSLAAGESTAYGTEIARDLALLAVSVALVVWPYSRLSVDNLVSDREIS
jgi:uncharacterized membrane protein YphA (DoxX/SURF4 family)